jgi:hypothetical protein
VKRAVLVLVRRRACISFSEGPVTPFQAHTAVSLASLLEMDQFLPEILVIVQSLSQSSYNTTASLAAGAGRMSSGSAPGATSG